VAAWFLVVWSCGGSLIFVWSLVLVAAWISKDSW
jgi:hypothetical protein